MSGLLRYGPLDFESEEKSVKGDGYKGKTRRRSGTQTTARDILARTSLPEVASCGQMAEARPQTHCVLRAYFSLVLLSVEEEEEISEKSAAWS